MFYLILMSSLLASDLYLWWWADKQLKGMRHANIWRVSAAAFCLTQVFFMLRILLWAYVPRHDSNIVIVMGFCFAYAWHLLVIPITLLGIAVLTAAKQIPRVHTTDASKEIKTSRRQLLRGGAVAIPPLLAIGGMGVAATELFRFRVRRLAIPLQELPLQLDGMTIALISDTHVGRFTNDSLLESIATASNALAADLTLFAGDLIDISLGDLDPAIRFARQLRGRYGVFFCEGNHDLIEDNFRRTNRFETETRAAGLPMLFDQSTTVRVNDYPVQIVGGRWHRTSEDRVRQTRELMSVRNPNAFGIFLTHHPHAWDQSLMPLTLSGHTHGGQLMLNERVGVGPIMFRYWSGIYRRGEQALVVGNGTGNWFPIRTMAPAEIVHLTLNCV